MRFKTLAKLLILLFTFLVILSGVRTCARSAHTPATVYTPPTPPGPPQPPPQQPQVPPPVQPVQPQQTAQVWPLSIQPIVVDEKIKELVKGNAVMDVYNVPCSPGDTLPPSPVFTGLWKETDTEKLSLSRVAPTTVFTQCTLTRLRYYYWAGADGIYTFAIHGNGADALKSVRINSVQVIPLTRDREATGQATLKTGWYEMDIRFYVNSDDYPHWHGYRLLEKRPDDNQMVVLTKDELFVTRTDSERLKK